MIAEVGSGLTTEDTSGNEILPETDQSLALSLDSTSHVSRVGRSYFLYRLPLHSWLNFIKMPECTNS